MDLTPHRGARFIRRFDLSDRWVVGLQRCGQGRRNQRPGHRDPWGLHTLAR